MVALVDGQPRLLNLKQILAEFLRHRREVVTRRTLFRLKKRVMKGISPKVKPSHCPISTR